MNRPRTCTLFLLLLLGAAVVFQSACTIIHVAVAANGKIVLHPKHGEIIKWAPPIQVRFLGPLCQEGTAGFISQCHVAIKDNQGYGAYHYICRKGLCSDPEVDVGTSTLLHGQAVAGGPPDPPADFQASFSCVGGTIVATPPDVTSDFYEVPVIATKVVQWVTDGQESGNGPLLVPDWVLTFDGGNTGVCNESDIKEGTGTGHRSCTLKALTGGATTKTFPYKVTSASSACNPGKGTVVETAQ